MTEIKPLDDVMNYFMLAFTAYIALFIVIIVNFLKALYFTKNTKSKPSKLLMITDLIIDIVCGLAMAYGMMFMGVLADNNALNWSYWNKWLYFISACSLIIFIANTIIVVANKKKFK